MVFHIDHDALKSLVNKEKISGRLARWIMLSKEFNYEVKMKSRKAISNVDFLSR